MNKLNRMLIGSSLQFEKMFDEITHELVAKGRAEPIESLRSSAAEATRRPLRLQPEQKSR